MTKAAAAERTPFLFSPAWRRALILQGALLLVAGSASADFYRYIGKDGVEVYTNIPTSDDAVRILREREERSKREAQKERKQALKAAKTQAKATPQSVEPEQKPLPGAEPQSTLQQPVWPVQGVLTSRVGWRHDPIDGTFRHHNGVDLAVPTGTVVKAVAAGTVVESGWHGGYGNLVAINHGDGTISMYGHNSQLGVRAGDRVEAGQSIALSGSTGRSTGPHLHFELWKNGSNVTEAYLSGTGTAGRQEVAEAYKSYQNSDGTLVFTNRY